jgi:hypothetical protein
MLSSTLKDILEPQKKKTIREKELKDKIIDMVIKKIKQYSDNGGTYCYFKVPPFLLGYIAYKQESLTKYLISKLYKDGFYVKEELQNIIMISWNIQDVQKVQDSKKKEKIKEINTSKDIVSFASTTKLK